jgi:acid stress-induced BolA-like protein IbaG/YrbA
VITAELIQDLIAQGLPGCQAAVEGDGRHWYATVIGEVFSGKSLLQQQRLVYGTLGDRLTSGEIHALSVKTYTPDDWQKAQASGSN